MILTDRSAPVILSAQTANPSQMFKIHSDTENIVNCHIPEIIQGASFDP